MLRLTYFLLYLIFRFFCKLKKPYVAKIPVISVGNITVGGTGKTPFVSWLIDFLKNEGFSPIIITRGYKSKGKGIRVLIDIQKQKQSISFYGDEAAMLSKQHSDIPIVISPNRVASLKQCSHLGDIAILDDGMQQLKIKKDLDIGMIDALVGFGNKKLLPTGILREPLSELQRNDFFVISRYNLQKNQKIIADLLEILPAQKPYYYLELIANSLVSSKNGKVYGLEKLKNKKIVLFSGIANPKGFWDLIAQEKKSKIIKSYDFPDHFHYKLENLQKIFADHLDSDIIFLTTEKDEMKLLSLQKKLPEFFVVHTKLNVPLALWKKLNNYLQKEK